ncbi:hypothetical protein [Longimicrobium terrae]|uniref:Lipoprotein n=1 Tax=Longimicrobium terrae TaxID=1639882 RepID=A0A841GZA3_9BACT|nr:hypothetical protein [Longimicrobium terrae]MBB4636393.1 hypothetical protein [Longimicrobium terrae]MBB6071083.1 hypothetical protein [Longimicrobium terrae]NNC29103.1 hypothetical protein [Longimicrobium terrae]
MKIRAALSLLAVAVTVSLGACSGSVTAPEVRPDARVALDSVAPLLDNTAGDSTGRTGGPIGSGN